ncbi:MOSC domain-containing protein [bacterium (Candidatus Blackallbacteria) CG17_big_fil_post_rev_8_21_14_2_50_48_46]|uniref:MOSC domain-containing protein n=1 Tax=bacterium (Candidatus Blackallbacteria) CG17_big_fil_post_rev_8_21_14_2_50_48_46 TaxID=2014261 RepID=A0A2M7FY16_9BACT|nr:MAG: MOSC domain-containing protein [bacterium (Candidatus Blackallbacteria) CG18_big_fil_WC_8_21_14_2_50_49_26]PIW14201.1 MAG: MOSC domain-containing protein [bacterium (Candidatus Blackallbacteria) CG17_big_fil_post_rev_8_21_14_2_50_48_46]PIW46742.1 MAG: MOSC domain-containing protein [bacterium (Candidatus Blackallbacteria) CG13_big_fil_rev_8_21_14_2_50_49_14]
MKLSQIWIYPIKSLQGIELQASRFEARGLLFDRRWMLVDSQGKFLSQRKIPAMASLKVELNEALRVFNPQGSFIQIPFPPYPSAKPMQVKIWNSLVLAEQLSEQLDHWFSEQLGQTVSLVYLPDSSLRPTSETWAPGAEVSFADGYPFLLTSEASLNALAAETGASLNQRLFRPNLVVKGNLAWEENAWGFLKIGDYKFQAVKPCTRCVMITQNPETGKSEHPQLLKQLQTQISWQNQAIFGENLIAHEPQGHLKIGDAIKPIASKAPSLIPDQKLRHLPQD